MTNRIEGGPAQMRLTLNPDGVIAAAQSAAIVTAQVVATCLKAFRQDDLLTDEAAGAVGYRFTLTNLDDEQRREVFSNWILTRGFTELLRGIRAALEEAHLYLSVSEWPRTQLTTEAKMQGELAAIRKRANTWNFHELFGEVNRRLTAPVDFEDMATSLQRARNCLEHRAGLIGPKDVDPGTEALTLRFPGPRLFLVKEGEEFDLPLGERAPGLDIEGPANVMFQLVQREIAFRLGELIALAPNDFFEIALACSIFAQNLGSKLPVLHDFGPGDEQKR
jgi:hypothetical protein